MSELGKRNADSDAGGKGKQSAKRSRSDLEASGSKGTLDGGHDAGKAVQHDDKGDMSEINYKVISNDGSDSQCEMLITLKNIFSKQLPKMPKDYIVRLVFDRRHKSLAMCRNEVPIAGICYRPFYPQRFAEIAFCAVTATEQVRGFGTKLMMAVKDHARTEGITHFLTCADNYAIGYFEKQGFTKNVTMPRDRWDGYIKDYDGSTLMECYIHPHTPHQDLALVLAQQRKYVYRHVLEVSHSHHQYPGLTEMVGPTVPELLQIPGVQEAGWDAASVIPEGGKMDLVALRKELQAILNQVSAQPAARHLLKLTQLSRTAQSRDKALDPVDLQVLQARLNEGYYRTKDMFRADLQRICQNAQHYSDPAGDLHDAAKTVEEMLSSLFK